MSIDIEPRVTRSAPTPCRVAIAACARLAADPLAYLGRRTLHWGEILSDDAPPVLCPTGDDERDFADTVSRMRGAMSTVCTELVCARSRRTYVECSGFELARAVGSAAREAFDVEALRLKSNRVDTLDAIEAWVLRRLVDELLELDSLERLEVFFEDLRIVAANARAEEYRAPDGFEARLVDGWSEIGMFVKRTFLGFNLMPLEAAMELLQGVQAFAMDVKNAVEGGDTDSKLAAKTFSAPDAMMTFVGESIEALERQSLGVETVLPERALDELGAFAPELPTLHYLRHMEALRRRDYPAAVEHLHRHFDISGEHDTVAMGARSNVGGFESANAGRERLQTALLALASTQLTFSHVDQAMFAISEAVRTAQQNADEESLAHALALTTSLLANAPVGLAQNTLYRDAQLLTLLRRLGTQAVELEVPHLMAYATLALAKYTLDYPESSSGAVGESRLMGRTAHVTKREDDAAPPTLATKSLISLEWARHFSQIWAATPASLSALTMANDPTTTDAALSTANDMYPSPKGFPSQPTSAYATRATASTLRSMTGAASSLAAEAWGTYGCSHLSKIYALRQLYHDREASVEDTAKSCAALIAHASECEGAAAADEMREFVEKLFGREVWSHKIIAVAFLKLQYEFAMGEDDYAKARDAVTCMRQLVDANAGADNALYFESRRLSANLNRMCGDFDTAQAELNDLIDDAQRVKDIQAEMWAKLSLAETHLSANSPSLALMRALPLELEAAEHGLEPIRTNALCIMCESWLKLGCSHAQLARHALDEHMLTLVSSDSLHIQSRAYLASARALVATTPKEEFHTVAERIIDALERAADKSMRLGARARVETCYAEIARAHHILGDVAARDHAAAKCRALARC